MFVLLACECHDPIRLPCLTVIVRERLLEARRIYGDTRKTIPTQDGFAVKRLLIEKLALSIFELADYRLGPGIVNDGRYALRRYCTNSSALYAEPGSGFHRYFIMGTIG